MINIVITYLHGGNDKYREIINIAFASAKRLGYGTILVGDGKGIVADHFLPLPANGLPLMDWIIKAQSHYLGTMFDCDTVIFSPDAVVLKQLEPVFEMDFDIAVTVREHNKCPVNNGVIYLKARRKSEIIDFWKDMQVKCAGYPDTKRRWYGDQEALHECLVESNDSPYGLRVLRLPVAKYNASPRLDTGTEEADRILLESAYVAHFKGNRKAVMKEFWHDLTSQQG